MSLEAAERYAKALFNISTQIHSEQLFFDQLTQLKNTFEKETIREYFFAPQINKINKLDLLDNYLRGNFEKIVVSFTKFLIIKHKLYLLPEIQEEFQQLLYKKKDMLPVSIISALPLEEDALLLLKGKLQACYNKHIVFTEKIDPRLIGGARIIIADKIIDFTLKSRLLKLKKTLGAFKP